MSLEKRSTLHQHVWSIVYQLKITSGMCIYVIYCMPKKWWGLLKYWLLAISAYLSDPDEQFILQHRQCWWLLELLNICIILDKFTTSRIHLSLQWQHSLQGDLAECTRTEGISNSWCLIFDTWKIIIRWGLITFLSMLVADLPVQFTCREHTTTNSCSKSYKCCDAIWNYKLIYIRSKKKRARVRADLHRDLHFLMSTR